LRVHPHSGPARGTILPDMASAFSHVAVALTVARFTARRRKLPLRFWVLSALCAVLPDADVIGFAFGIRYGDLLGHRGLSHALSFALLTGLVVVTLAFRDERPFSPVWWVLVAHFFTVTASHGVLDAMTDGGLGVAFLSPLDPTRYFFPFRPITVSPIGVGSFFSEWGLRVVINEVLWIGAPCILVWAVLHFRGRMASPKHRES